MVCDVMPYKHIFFSSHFLWNDGIASMSVVIEWFKFRLEDCVRRIGNVGCVPVIYVVHLDWKTFTKLFTLTPHPDMPAGCIYNCEIAIVSCLCIHGIHPTPINKAMSMQQWVFDLPLWHACMLNPNDPLTAWNILKTEDAQNVIDVQHFSTSRLDLKALKEKNNSCLHRQIKFEEFRFGLITNRAGDMLVQTATPVDTLQIGFLVLQCDEYDNVGIMISRQDDSRCFY